MIILIFNNFRLAWYANNRKYMFIVICNYKYMKIFFLTLRIRTNLYVNEKKRIMNVIFSTLKNPNLSVCELKQKVSTVIWNKEKMIILEFGEPFYLKQGRKKIIKNYLSMR